MKAAKQKSKKAAHRLAAGVFTALLLCCFAALPCHAQNDPPPPAEPLAVISLSQKPLVVGQWVIIRDQRSDKSSKPVVHYFKREIARTPADQPVLRQSIADEAGQFHSVGRAIANGPTNLEALAVQPDAIEQQMLEIQGKSYNCQVLTYRFTTTGSSATRVLKLWRAQGLTVCPPALPIPNAQRRIVRLPIDTLQCEWTIHTSDYDAKRRTTLQSPSETVRIGDRNVTCSHYRDTTVARHKGGKDLAIITDVWLNDAILGRHAKWIQYDSDDVTKVTATRTVTDFHTPTQTDAAEHADD